MPNTYVTAEDTISIPVPGMESSSVKVWVVQVVRPDAKPHQVGCFCRSPEQAAVWLEAIKTAYSDGFQHGLRTAVTPRNTNPVLSCLFCASGSEALRPCQPVSLHA
jgi:hypothetical protein